MRFATISLALLLGACSGDDGSCLENETRPCLGPGGCEGFQTCVGGTGYTPCECIGSQPDGSPPQTDAGTTDDGAIEADSSSSTSAEAPKILNLTSNVNQLTPDKKLIITAVVTDPQGIGDLIGGQLEEPAGGTYDSFATASQEGSYSLTLSWDDINQVSPINAAVSGSSRVFRARFYDQAGNETTKDLTIKLLCGDGMTACAGECHDLQNETANCGKCGFDCEAIDSDVSAACVSGVCLLAFYSYSNAFVDGNSLTCNQICSGVLSGYGCVEVEWRSWCCAGDCPKADCALSVDAASAGAGCDIGWAKCTCAKKVKAP